MTIMLPARVHCRQQRNVAQNSNSSKQRRSLTYSPQHVSRQHLLLQRGSCLRALRTQELESRCPGQLLSAAAAAVSCAAGAPCLWPAVSCYQRQRMAVLTPGLQVRQSGFAGTWAAAEVRCNLVKGTFNTMSEFW
jgi:hypothetical protein